MNESQWYYAEDGEQRGPVEEAALRERFLSGELPKDTLVWAVGMEDWAPAVRVPSLITPPPPPPPPVQARVEPLPAGAEGGSMRTEGARAESGARTSAEELVRPWKRLLARFLDLILFFTVVEFAVLRAVLPAEPMETLGWLPMALIQAVVFLAWSFVEPLFLARNGMTPGKWVFRVRVVHQEQRFLSYGEGLKRSLRVFFSGLGAGLPPFYVILPALAYREVLDHGATSWDRAVHGEVQFGEMRPLHTGIAAGFLLLMALQVVSVLVSGG